MKQFYLTFPKGSALPAPTAEKGSTPLSLFERGKGLCFVARQKRVTVDGDHFYVDLVFYNRLRF